MAELLPKDINGFLGHLRLKSNFEEHKTSQEAFSTSAQTLLHEESLFTAIERLSGLPIPLPKPLLEAFTILKFEEQRTLIKRLLKIFSSPISQIHLICLLINSGDEHPVFHRLIRQLIRHLFGDRGAEEFRAFQIVLRWTYEEFYRKSERHAWPVYFHFAIT